MSPGRLSTLADSNPDVAVRAIELAKLRLDGGTQLRADIDENLVAEYAEQPAGVFPPVAAFFDGSEYWVADGHHRTRAAARRGDTTINCRIHQGSLREAILFACGANGRHGLRRSNRDKRRAVATLLEDPEWRQFSDRKLAELAGVSNEFVSTMRAELSTDDTATDGGNRIGRDGKVRPARQPKRTLDEDGADNAVKQEPGQTSTSKRKRRREPTDAETIVSALQAIDVTIDAARRRIKGTKGLVLIGGMPAEVAVNHHVERLGTMRKINSRLRRQYH